jgi:hypothetical protein
MDNQSTFYPWPCRAEERERTKTTSGRGSPRLNQLSCTVRPSTCRAFFSVSDNEVILGTTDGSLVQVLALADTTFKRLSLLQGQLVRNIQHTAGLNPRANR